MKAKYGHSVVDIWEISHDEPQEEWVHQLFESGQFQWKAKKTYIQAVGSWMMYGLVIGYIGDYLIKEDSYRVIKEKEFVKHYEVISE